MSPNNENAVQGDECGCDVCATGWHELTGEQKLSQLAHESERDWKQYAEQLEGENYQLTQDLAELQLELDGERSRCQNCGKHK